jgi:hypothetical protein
MTARNFFVIIIIVLVMTSAGSAQNPKDLVQQAQQYLDRSDYRMAAELLSKALNQIQELMLVDLKSCFPDAPGGWRAEDVKGTVVTSGREIGLSATRSYYREGGGSSIDIKIETNSLRTENIRSLIVSPSKLQRVDATMNINTIAEHRCLEKYDPVDKYGEIIFVPTPSVIVTFKAFDCQDTKMLSQFAKQMNWSALEIKFP